MNSKTALIVLTLCIIFAEHVISRRCHSETGRNRRERNGGLFRQDGRFDRFYPGGGFGPRIPIPNSSNISQTGLPSTQPLGGQNGQFPPIPIAANLTQNGQNNTPVLPQPIRPTV
ncbi:uncharacterized protein LOC129567167 [Sitodiplosis mosellana]|uniref:uncharacterized protein LOC129567167 n=1 Tax=Sitodiplosis mosellana TaxID=263140 RepID=UPI0024442CDC|nr:uncharacterized protein LOC129567167 [Sitodiplosis mosellana]